MAAPQDLPGGYRSEGPAQVRTDSPAGPPPVGYESIDGSLVARYTADPDGVMVIGAAWGTITDPAAVATSAFAAMESSRGKWTVPPTDADARDPYDRQGRLTCGVRTEALLVIPTCLWVDHSTAGSVSFPPWAEGSLATLDPTAAADRTRRIRDAMTTPK
ncbi:hypothetical protein [Kitasatospora purpeofusca]|uniref:hypothetical protein n=1 Tax=Kitasatospora purpeofusca TaxID=67352 RepID=UPI0036C754F8